MRTTVAIDDRLLASARACAHQRKQTLSRLVEQALQRELARPLGQVERPEIPIFRSGDGPRPGLDLASNRSLMEGLDGGRALEQLR